MLVEKLETVMSDSPARWASRKHLSGILGEHAGPPTRRQRHIGVGVAIFLMLAALIVIILLDHYGILH
jgi:hypothetical protein